MGLDRITYLMALEVSKGVNHPIVQTSPLKIETVGLRRVGECLKGARGWVHRIGVAELGVVDGQCRQMARCAPDLAEQGFPFSCKLIISILIIVLHSNWHRQPDLENGDRGGVTDRQLVGNSVLVRVGPRSIAFGRLHTVMLIEGADRKLANRTLRPLAREWLDDEVWI